MKAFAFANDLNFSEETKEKLWRFALFQVGIYIPHFLMSSCGSDAAVNDLALHKKLRKFREDDEILAEEALKTLKRHLWYLSELTIPLFSDKVDEDIKSRLAAKLLSLKKNKKDKVGSQKLSKLKFPKILPNTDLYDLATEEPLEFFSIIKVDSKWLEQAVDSWDNSGDFQTTKTFVSTVKTTNDLAERAIKTATDYAQILTKNEDTRRRIIQGVEDHRRAYPDFSKKTLNN